ncbi:hypothetical protein CsatB_000608 [Cannabis sativa]|uniref:Uncharacterized protein n=1 Tax=Cannabis sativa TaxID=3483 RepID=A0A803QGE2_CANSA|nr:uncharacterized protein LOC115697295 [Cannabis sativa]
MAESFDGAEFWLPPEFLTDDDVLIGMNSKTKNDKDGLTFGAEADAYTKSLFPYEFPCGFGSLGVPSDLSSPVDSVLGSSETESDEEEYLAGLTLQMARSTLEGGFKNIGSENGKPRTMSGSPQSTLCAVGNVCGCGQGSSRESPKAHSRVSSPPKTWDLLNAAAGEVAKMRLNEEEYMFYHSRGLLGPPRKPSPVANTPNPDIVSYLNQPISQKQLQVSQFQQLKHQQMMKQQNSVIWGPNTATQAKGPGRYQMSQAQPMAQNRARNNEFMGVTKNNRPLGLSPSAWPSLQQGQSQPNGSGMRAVFLGNPVEKRESVGTGVFLPRQVGAQPETRRKPACATVLLPARVVQALNLNLDDMVGQPQLHPRYNGRFGPETDVSLRLRSNNNVVPNNHHQRQRNMRPQQLPVVNHEIRLPQDWTY